MAVGSETLLLPEARRLRSALRERYSFSSHCTRALLTQFRHVAQLGSVLRIAECLPVGLSAGRGVGDCKLPVVAVAGRTRRSGPLY